MKNSKLKSALSATNNGKVRPSETNTHGDDRLRIAGGEGILEVLGVGEQVRLLRTRGKSGELPLLPAVDFFAAFVAALRGESQPLVSNVEAFDITRYMFEEPRRR